MYILGLILVLAMLVSHFFEYSNYKKYGGKYSSIQNDQVRVKLMSFGINNIIERIVCLIIIFGIVFLRVVFIESPTTQHQTTSDNTSNLLPNLLLFGVVFFNFFSYMQLNKINNLIETDLSTKDIEKIKKLTFMYKLTFRIAQICLFAMAIRTMLLW